MCGMYVSYASNETTDGPDNASLLFCRHRLVGKGCPHTTCHSSYAPLDDAVGAVRQCLHSLCRARSRDGRLTCGEVRGCVEDDTGFRDLWASGPLGVSAALLNDAWDAYRGAEIEIEIEVEMVIEIEVEMVMEIEVEMVIEIEVEMVMEIEMVKVKVKVGRGT